VDIQCVPRSCRNTGLNRPPDGSAERTRVACWSYAPPLGWPPKRWSVCAGAKRYGLYLSQVSEVTRILDAVGQGDPTAAEALLPLVYDELRRQAAARMALEPAGHTLQPTALVHEAWIRLAGQRNQHYKNRHLFFGAAAEVMRRILVDRARRRRAARHGGGLEQVELDAIEIPNTDDELIQGVHEALEALGKLDSEKAEIVKLRFFVGLSFEEIAALLGVNERTVRRHWTFAKAWMCRELGVEEKQSSTHPLAPE
jgi:RNA polymerase sigma factor (TIGR02999 family)